MKQLTARLVVASIALILSCFSSAHTVIYQPLNRDASVSIDQWKAFVDDIYAKGYREIVIQWSQYGSVNFWRKGSFIKEPMDYASSKGFKFWLGLYLPEDYYQRMEQENGNRDDYFEEVIRKNRHLLARLEIQNIVDNDNLLGWYMPTELTHSYMKANDKDSPSLNLGPLKQLTELNQKPTAISYFLGDNTSVQESLSDLSKLSDAGLDVWLQRGNGLNKLTLAEDVIQKMNCDFAVINENFQQTSISAAPFSARSSSVPAQNKSSCHKPILFSLRYMPSSPLEMNQSPRHND